jgi:MFS family permease
MIEFISSVDYGVSKTMGKHGWITKFAFLRFFLTGCETYFVAPTAWTYIKFLHRTEIFLALVLSAYNFGAILAGPLSGLLTDRLGNPRFIFICSCVTKVLAYVIYSINLSVYFPLFGRLISGLSDVGLIVLLGQIALQPNKESRAGYFVLADGAYCLGTTFGPGLGSFITFRANIHGWQINEGNSPGIILTIIWLLFLIFSLLLPNDIWIATGAHNMELNSIYSEDENDKTSQSECNQEQRLTEKKPSIILWDSRVFCLLFLVFCSEALSSTSTFLVPVLASDHFHLQLIDIKLLFLNCTLFTLLVLICIHHALRYIEERKLFVVALLMQIIALSFLTSLAFSWNQVTDVQWYIMLLYICLGMPYFAFPLANSILSKIIDPRNATFIQGLSFGTLESAIVINRVVISFVFTKMSLLCYCFGMVILWSAGIIWYGTLYKRMVPNV